jgi:hypothetical protein
MTELNLEGVLSSTVIQIYASQLVAVMDHLSQLEIAAKSRNQDVGADSKIAESVSNLLVAAVENCSWLKLRSAMKQLRTILNRVQSGNCSTVEFSGLIQQLRIRIFEDLQDRAFFCVANTDKLDRFFKQDPKGSGNLVYRDVREIFDVAISKRFPECVEDLTGAAACYVACCYTACVFHLMRVVEYGVVAIARLASETLNHLGTLF